MHASDLSTPLGYHGMRLRWCRDALLRLLRRWAVYIVVGALVIGAGASGAWQAITAVAAWLVLPLFVSASHGAWLAAGIAMQGLAGGLVAVALSPLLWQRTWADAERALPIAPGLRLASDAAMVAMALAPLLLLCTVGAVTLLGHRPAWLLPYRDRAIAALLAAVALSIALGTAFLQWQRRSGDRGARAEFSGVQRQRTSAADALRGARAEFSGVQRQRTSAADALHVGTLRWPRALVWWPLWRGPARRTGLGLWLGTATLCVPAVGLALITGFTGWWLAGFATLALVSSSVLDAVARKEFADLHEACRPLPIKPTSLGRMRASIALAPLLPGLATLPIALAVSHVAVRPLVLAGYVVACIGSCALEVAATARDAQSKASRWLLVLIVAVALASEVAA